MSVNEVFSEMTDVMTPFVEVCHQLYQKEYVCAYDGNVSMRFDNVVLATPTHLCKGVITAEDLIVVDMAGHQLAGERNPTSELKVHLAVYQNNPEVTCIIHAHPLYATAFYREGRRVNASVLTEAEATLGVVPVVPHYEPGSVELAEAVGCAMQGKVCACIMENHGVVVGGKDLEETYFLLTSLERLAKTEYLMANLK